MNFEASRASALNELNNFVENNLSNILSLEILILDQKIDLIFLVYLHILHME